jgi:hypothetical protein
VRGFRVARRTGLTGLLALAVPAMASAARASVPATEILLIVAWRLIDASGSYTPGSRSGTTTA